MTFQLADRMARLKASEIREILKITENPEIISFAGGLPAPELFPVEQMKVVSTKILEESGMQALQYATTEGFPPLREKIAQRMNALFKTGVSADNILITTGSQQGLDMTGKIFINKGDIILCESPTYLGAISAFKAYEPEFLEIDTDDDGMVLEGLEIALKTIPRIKFIYTIPDFQNPTGKTWSIERRKRFMEIVSNYNIAVIEDNPYGELRFEGDIPPSLKSMDQKGQVIYLGTFSKTFCPGMRIAWIAADKDILSKYILTKQGTDLHTSSISQREISRFIELYDFDAHVDRIKQVYRRRRDKIVSCMKEMLPPGVRFTNPAGGLFTWVELPEHINAREVLLKCLEEKVAFVPGDAFYANRGKMNTFRMNFSNMPEDRIEEGMARLARVLETFM